MILNYLTGKKELWEAFWWVFIIPMLVFFVIFVITIFVVDADSVENSDPVKKITYVKNQEAVNSQAVDPELEYYVARIYETGAPGIEKNAKEAAKWYQKAANKGHIFAKTNLAVMYARGNGVQKNSALAVKLYQEASDLGDDVATYDLGLQFELGDGIEQNYSQAFKYYLKAAQQGVLCAQNDLGALYASGKGVKQNDTQAAFWFGQAFDSPDTDYPYTPTSTMKENRKAFIEYRLAISKKIQIFSSSPESIKAAKYTENFFENKCRK